MFINPGHGGNDDNDRHRKAGNRLLGVGGNLRGRDSFSGACLKPAMQRYTCHAPPPLLPDDLPLSTIATMANTANADIFISTHSNGFDGTRNQHSGAVPGI
ncbi:MAG: hypothetical protein MZV63_62170 [Marinilabiliales bacterium]|nr:hypothetical protein [Marinilabiliales bacterium]